MRRLICVLAVVLLAAAARAENPTVLVHETTTIEIPGATAAYAIDPSIADVATASPGRVAITGLSPGSTQLIVVTPAGSQTYLIRVGQRRSSVAAPSRPADGVPAGTYEARYSTGASQFLNSFDVFVEEKERRSQFHLLNIHYLGQSLGHSANAFPSVSYRVTTRSRDLTLGDALLDVSQETIRSTLVRGFHLQQGPLELHAGYAASTLYDDLLLPADRRWVATAGYAVDSRWIRWIPTVYAFLSEPAGSAARRGAIGSLAAEHRHGDTFFARAELAVSRSVGGAAEVRYDSSRDHLRGQASYKPNDFPTLGLADIPGTHAELAWTRRATDRLTLDSYGTFDRLNVPAIHETVGIANLDGRYTLSRYLAILTGVDSSTVQTAGASIRTIAVPIGLTFDASRFGAAATYRFLDVSGTRQHGDVLRVSARASSGGFHANVWAERQRHAPSLDLIFREEPALELALLRLGISVHSPDDIARALRDNAALINLGFIQGVTVNLSPRRVTGGFDVSWLAATAGHDQLRLHGIVDHNQSIGSSRDSVLATATYSRRLFASTDIYGSYSRWRTRTTIRQNGSAVEVGLRQRFDGLPSFARSRGTIEGFVFLDPDMHGIHGEGTAPLADISVMLDGNRTAHTDRNGAYSFSDVRSGPHHVVAQLPQSRPAFFTTPSHADVDAAAHVDFGLVWSPARVSGHVLSDARVGLREVGVVASTLNGARITATTDSSGAFVLALPPGQYRVNLSPESLPSGYIPTSDNERSILATGDKPQVADFEIQALRSIAGSVGGDGFAEVEIEPLGLTTRTDLAGHFVFRSLPRGTFTLKARRNGRTAIRTVTLPDQPATLVGIVIDQP